MSIAATEPKRPWALVGVAAGVILLLVAVLVFADLPGKQLLSSGGTEPLEPKGAAAVPQARWEIKTHPAGVMNKVTKAQSERIQRQRPQVASLVKKVYDALLVRPGRLRSTLRDNFTPLAAKALRRSAVAAPQAGLVSTKKRTARIGIQAAGGPTLAVATVSLRAALADDPLRRVAHDSTLWMERRQNGWKVVAFQLDQRPVGEHPGEKKRSSKKLKNG